MAKVIIFGIQDYAQLAHYYLTHDSSHEVIAFCVNNDYIPDGGRFCDLPVIPFEDIEQRYPPGAYSFFAPMAPKNMNGLREKIYFEIKKKGYGMISYVSSKLTMFDNQIGDNCFILEDNTIQPFTTIGNNVVLWSGNHIGHHSRIEDHVTFTSHVVMSGHCIIGANSFLGVNATLRDGITLAPRTLIAMAAAVTRDTEAGGVYIGNPAKKMENKLSTEVL